MIDIDVYKRLDLDNIKDSKFHAIVLSYNKERKNKNYINNLFDIYNEISDKEKLVDKLIEIVFNSIGTDVKAMLENNNFSWYPKWMIKKYNDTEYIKNYLEKFFWIKRYFGCLENFSLSEFLNIFIDYPLRYNYQNIEIFTKKNNFVFVITHHGTFFIIGEREDALMSIKKKLELNEVSVLKC